MDKQKVIVNFIWRLMERCGAQLVTTVVALVLARLLEPEIYGVVALVTVITTVLNVFIDSGLGTALIQKKDADDLDFSSVFYFNMVMCVGIYGLVFLIAPLMADFFRMPDLTTVIRVLGLTLVLSGVKNIQTAYVSRQMIFKKFFFATLGGTIGAAAVGLWMAFQGYGVWALVAQSLFNNTVDTLILWITVPWRPKRMFSLQRLRGLFSYGWKLLVTGLMSSLYSNLRQLIIGKMYSAEDLAFYNRGMQFPNLITANLLPAVDNVLLPVMSSRQDDLNTVLNMNRRAVRTISYLIWPMMLGLAACGESLIRLLLTEKWLPALPYLWIYCVDYSMWPLDAANLNAIKAIGRSDVFLKLQIINRTLGVVVLLVTMPHGVFAMALGLPVLGVLGQLVNAVVMRRVLNYSFRQQAQDILPSVGLAGVMAVCVWAISLLGFSDGMSLLIQIPLGVAVYLGGSVLLRFEIFHYLRNTLKEFLKRK